MSDDPGMPEPPAAHPVPPGPEPTPFAPRVREPWINPTKRRAAALLAVAAAVVLLGLGALLGAGLSGGHGREHDGYRGGVRSNDGMPYRGGRHGPMGGQWRFQRPALPGATVTVTATPSPSSSHR